MCGGPLGFTLPEGVDWKDVYAKGGCCNGMALAIFRIVLALLWLAVVIWSLGDWAEDLDIGYWFTKLTHWGALLELAYFVLLAATTTLAVSSSSKQSSAGGSTPCLVRVTWFLGSAMPAVTFLILALYWILVYTGGDIAVLSVVVHGGNYAIVLVDFFTTRQPFYFRHVWVPALFGIIYSLFTVVYYVADGTNEDGVNTYIYSAIDWESKPGQAFVYLAASVLIGVPATHGAHWLLAMLRQSCCGGSGAEEKVHPASTSN
mmetsp:Transcript_31939/g.74785  ORF Transcript_31939/g.74785 Transcript_31939/m.74785 type:complete len:260 (-) Transcript_31939:224-1003(-)